MRVLSFFNEHDVIYISEISHDLRMSIQSVTNLVSRLETMGYIGRSKNSKDKRFSEIRLTAKGRKGFDAFRNEQLETLANILNNLEPIERKILSATIENAALVLEKAVLKASDDGEATVRQPIRSTAESK
jgi:DNA-binding MarR family transcriptional regulator